MRPLAACLAFAFATLVSTSIFAAQSSPFETFQSFKQLTSPGMETIRDIVAFPMEARYELIFGRDLSTAQRDAISNELTGVPGHGSNQWQSDARLELRFDSPMIRVGVLQWRRGARTVVIGLMRDHGFLLRFFAGPSTCRALLPADFEGVESNWSGLCSGEAPDLRDLRDVGLDAHEEEIAELLRLQIRSDWSPDPSWITRYVERFGSDESRIIGWLTLAVVHLSRLEEADALSQLEAIASIVAENPSAQTAEQAAFAADLGKAALYRLVERQLAQQGLAVLRTWERFSRWRGDSFPISMQMAVAERFRKSESPRDAIAIYRSLIGAPGLEQPLLFAELGTAFIEAGDTFRAAATASYLEEKYPERPLPARLQNLKATRLMLR